MNREKKRELYRQRIDRAQHDSKKLWKVMNDIMGRSTNASASFIETDNGVFIRHENGLGVKKVRRILSL